MYHNNFYHTDGLCTLAYLDSWNQDVYRVGVMTHTNRILNPTTSLYNHNTLNHPRLGPILSVSVALYKNIGVSRKRVISDTFDYLRGCVSLFCDGSQLLRNAQSSTLCAQYMLLAIWILNVNNCQWRLEIPKHLDYVQLGLYAPSNSTWTNKPARNFPVRVHCHEWIKFSVETRPESKRCCEHSTSKNSGVFQPSQPL